MDPKSINRVYSTMVLKAVDEDKREISGIASTPGTDRMGDIVEPAGAEFLLPVPLLWQHDHSQPIGNVTAARVTAKGIEIRASLVKPTAEMPSQLVARLEGAWQSIKTGLVRGLSIGFSPLEYAFMEDGIRFLRWNWHELSAVTIPANAEASITAIKSLDTALRAASGTPQGDEVGRKPAPPGVSGTTKQPASGGFFYARTKGKSAMNVADQIKALEDKRSALTSERTSIQTKAVEEGRTKDAAEQERFAEITAEVTAIDKELADLRVMEKDLAVAAKPVNGATDKSAAESREGLTTVQVKDNRVRGEGIAMAQVAKCLFKAQGNLMGALQFAEQEKHLDPRVPTVLKAAVAAGSTSNAAWAGNLVGDETTAYADFVEFLRPRTIIGRFGNNGIPSLRPAPFRVPLLGQTSGGAGYWVGEGNAKPLTSFDFSRTTIEPLKVANIAILTMETVRDSSPKADVVVRDGLVKALAERMDIDFVDPDKAAVPGISPASITNGVTEISSSGSSAAAIRADIRKLWQPFIAANNPPTTAVYIMSATTALALSLMVNDLGTAPEFPGITMNGGTFMGVPVIVSEYLANNGGSAGGIVVLANASDIWFADEGGFQVDLSMEASVQMDTAPDNPTTSSTVLVSLWQRNLVGFRAERTVNWARRGTAAVSWLGSVTWGQ